MSGSSKFSFATFNPRNRDLWERGVFSIHHYSGQAVRTKRIDDQLIALCVAEVGSEKD